MAGSVRRSQRSRRQAESFYNDAKQEMEDSSTTASSPGRKTRTSMESSVRFSLGSTASKGSVRSTRSASSKSTPSARASPRLASKARTPTKQQAKRKAAAKKTEIEDEEEKLSTLDEEEEEEKEDPTEHEEEEDLDEPDLSSDEDENDSDAEEMERKHIKTPSRTPKTPVNMGRISAKTRVTFEPSTATPSPLFKEPIAETGGNLTKRGKYELATAYGTSNTRRSVNSALAMLGRKVLEEGESPETSLVAALIFSYKGEVSKRAGATFRSGSFSSHPRTPFTTQLEAIAKKVVSTHNDKPNDAQVSLLNLIFRSVGGAQSTNLEPTDRPLDDMNDEEWATVVTDLVDEMRHTPADRILFCADPDGAVHAEKVDASGDSGSSLVLTQSSLGVRVYRQIYEEFWYVLGGVALSEGIMSTTRDGALEEGLDDEIENSSDEDATGKKRKKKGASSTPRKKAKKNTKTSSTIRFDAELARDLISRVVELTSVGQPDVRAAATIAALRLGQAVLDKTVVLGTKLEVATRQYAAASSGGGSRKTQSLKAESLRHQVDSLKRTRADLEEVAIGLVVQGVFVHRYRDANMHIRSACLDALSTMTVQRPDLFLLDKYLKYFGWMMSDKATCVRSAALRALLRPFEAVHGSHLPEVFFSSTNKTGTRSSTSAQQKIDSIRSQEIDLGLLENVSAKFLPRIVDCVIDVSVDVQEVAMRLLLALLRDGFLDDVDDESVWNQVNICALASDTSPSVRRDALYFIMEQLEAFDEGDNEDGDQNTPTTPLQKQPAPDPQSSGKKSSGGDSISSAESSERRTAQRLDALASWIAHALTDGPIPIDRIRVDLCDHVVHSLRAMPEHMSISTNWSAMLKAISDDNVATTVQGMTAGDRADVAKQRVLVQMLACAARAQVAAVADPTFLEAGIDPDVAAAKATPLDVPVLGKKGGTTKANKGHEHESLSVALLMALPSLLVKFKSDSAILGSLTSLPRYMLPSVFSLPQRKVDFGRLTKNLGDIFLQSSDEIVLRNVGLSLTFLTEGDHARASDARLQLKFVVESLRDRLVAVLSKENIFTAVDDTNEEDSKAPLEDASIGPDGVDTEHALHLNLKRLRILCKRRDLSEFLGETGGDNDGVESLCTKIFDGLAERLNSLKPLLSDDDDDEKGKPDPGSTIWNRITEGVHKDIAQSAKEGLTLMLTAIAWKLYAVQEEEGLVIGNNEQAEDGGETEENSEEIEDHVIIRMRKRLINLIELCFEQYLPEAEVHEEGAAARYTPEQVSFSYFVQESASKISSDLRTLLPREWSDAASPLLRAFSITKDGLLIGGFVRYLRSKEGKLRKSEDTANESEENEGTANKSEENEDVVRSLLLPMCRNLVVNWSRGNRREAGVALAHITGSGQEANDLVSSMSKIMKKIEPVRLLEAHMASLRQSYEDWVDNEPDELESERPTDEEMAAFEEAEKRHESQFQALEVQASRLSTSLGVVRLSDKKLAPALLGFLREGIRFAFSSSEEDGQDDMVLGGRLSFLRIVTKYCGWVHRKKSQKELLRNDLDRYESSLREHPDYKDVHEDDLVALFNFRIALRLKETSVAPDTNQRDDAHAPEEDAPVDADGLGELSVSSEKSVRTMKSQASSAGSLKSKVSSAQSSLSPLYEEPAEAEHSSDEELSPKKRRRHDEQKKVTTSRSDSGQLSENNSEGSGPKTKRKKTG